MRGVFSFAIILARSKLNAKFNIKEIRMRTLNSNTLERMTAFINDYQREHGLSPSYRQIMHGIGMSSLNLVQRYVLALEKQGKIKRTDLGNIEIPERFNIGETTPAPLVGQIACGQPNFAEEDIEGSFALPRAIFGSGSLFMLHASGESMIEAGIADGDLLVLRKANSADDGDIVVAMIDGDTTLKRLFHKGNKIVLHPENKSMKDIVVPRCEVQGVLVSCIKLFN